MRNLWMPRCDWTSDGWATRLPSGHPPVAAAQVNRSLVAMTHVQADPTRAAASAGLDAVNREATPLRLWAMGPGAAEAMDMAQRGMRTAWAAVERPVDDTLLKMTRALSLNGLV